jgi:hypothetical protein
LGVRSGKHSPPEDGHFRKYHFQAFLPVKGFAEKNPPLPLGFSDTNEKNPFSPPDAGHDFH